MGSSAKTGKKIFYGSQEQFLDKTFIWDRTPPHLYIKCSVYVWGRAQGSQIFKRNSIISIRSKVMAFFVILLSPWSPHCPRRPRRPPSIPTSSPSSPRHPHSPQKVPMWSPSSPSSPWSPLSPPVLSPLSPRRPRRPHIVPVIPMSSPRRLEGPQIIPNPPDSHPTHPHPPGGGGGPRITKNAIRFELIKIF